MNVVSLDPGITTGYAIGRIDSSTREMLIVSGEVRFSPLELWKFLGKCKPSYLICERFEFRHGSYKHGGVEMFPRELIGVCKMYCEDDDNNCELKLQPAMKSNATTFFDDERLKKFGVYKTARGHANDAIRHLLYWSKFKAGYQYVDTIRSGVLE